MSLPFANKVAAITGGASGIGRASAEALVAGGARVVIVDRDSKALATACEAMGANAIALELDLLDPVGMTRGVRPDDADHQGPLVAKEFLNIIAEGLGNLISYHSEWIRLSGGAEGEAVAHAPDHGLGASGCPDLAVGRADVGLHGVDRQVGLTGDLCVGQPTGDQGDDLALPDRQAVGLATIGAPLVGVHSCTVPSMPRLGLS